MAPVESGDLSDAQAFRGGDDRRIDCAQRQVAVAGDEFGDPQPIHHRHGFDVERATGEVPEETHLRVCTEARCEQVHDLGDDPAGHDERTWVGLEQLERGIVVCIVRVDVGVERSGIDDERGYRATSAARISSMRSETSLRPLCPAPAAPSRRRLDESPK
ncbi:MAG TPA: hypothetical protein VFJ19_09980 [Nocardioidaceae bacterium]|nr:hypothetical protein [Nocardioidaceae bacterium]